MLEVRNLTKRFGGLIAIENLDFSIQRGEIVGLIGPNGAGKTTIFNLITGYLRPDSGVIKFEGDDIVGLKPYQICKKGICRTFQLVKPFLNMNTLENVMTGALSRTRSPAEARKEAKNMLDFVGLSGSNSNLAANLTMVDRKRLELARALCTQPKLLLLDEPIGGLNPKETLDSIELIKRIRDRGITIVIIEHVMKVIMSISDRIIVINYGEKIAEGKPRDISENVNVIQAYLGREYSLA